MFTKQISIFVENRHGRLAEITDIIGRSGINIRALSIADTTQYGILRIIVDEPETAEKALKEHGLTVSITSVLKVKLDDAPGGLAKVLRVLADNDIAVEYMYAFISNDVNSAYVVMRIEEDLKAEKILAEAGFVGDNK